MPNAHHGIRKELMKTHSEVYVRGSYRIHAQQATMLKKRIISFEIVENCFFLLLSDSSKNIIT